MPNIAAVLKSEIVRISKKVARQETGPVRTASSTARTQLATLRKQVQQLQREVALLRRTSAKPQQPRPESDAETIRYSAKGLRSLRKRLNLSAQDFGKLTGVSAQTIYSWESEHTSPRRGQKAKLASLRRIGKREALARLQSK